MRQRCGRGAPEVRWRWGALAFCVLFTAFGVPRALSPARGAPDARICCYLQHLLPPTFCPPLKIVLSPRRRAHCLVKSRSRLGGVLIAFAHFPKIVLSSRRRAHCLVKSRSRPGGVLIACALFLKIVLSPRRRAHFFVNSRSRRGGVLIVFVHVLKIPLWPRRHGHFCSKRPLAYAACSLRGPRFRSCSQKVVLSPACGAILALSPASSSSSSGMARPV